MELRPSPAEFQRVMTNLYTWVESLTQRGMNRGAQIEARTIANFCRPMAEVKA